MHKDIDQLIRLFAKLPGLGPRSARRTVLHLLENKEAKLAPLIQALETASNNVVTCDTCGNLDSSNPCQICDDHLKRDRAILCIVEEVADVWAMERSGVYRGLYHILGGKLSAIDGIGPEQLRIHGLIERADSDSVTEVIMATSATVEGQTTAHYITSKLEGTNCRITRLAQGIPVGGELDYLDDGTLSTALQARLPA